MPTPDPVDANSVLSFINPGTNLIVPIANGEPVTLMNIIESEIASLQDLRVHQMHVLHDRPYLHGKFPNMVHVSYFLSEVTRLPYWEGHIELVPNHFSEVPELMRQKATEPLVIAASSLPDQHGYFSLGVSADYVASLIGRVPFFLEATPYMPVTRGSNIIHHSQILGWTLSEQPLVEVPRSTPNEKDSAIAALIAERIEDRATIQIGIGSIAEALLKSLINHRDIGVHTELLHDGMMDLVEAGVITGVAKEVRRNRMVTTFALGTHRLYDWLHNNTSVEFLGVDFVNDPRVISRMAGFVSVNATTEIDLLGQCASETIAGKYWSSSGGQADFARGAMYSEGGQAFIVTRAATSSGKSRIVASLSKGSVVTTTKNTVDHVVTEYGVAELRGRSLAQRARALIAIAAPEHREDLERAAKERLLLH